ncbi:MAG: hypothetical protein ACOYNB_00300 [Aquabacterium sp.]|jgi:hypothetical protein|uniref:hypothetical protein n=1 Tax=Aquabacterium sp. TaxID=1872578 RepID=UPI003BCA7002
MKMSIEVVDLLQAAHNGYFKILMENYPSANRDDTHTFAAFGPPELCELATEVHACAIALGKEARDRLLYIGLDVLYPFDNPVDLYNWRSHVLAKKIDHTIYASIAIRIDGELKRLRRALELGGMQAYAGLAPDVLLVSKARYQSPSDVERPSTDRAQVPSVTTVNINHVSMKHPGDASAINDLEALEKKTSVWSNVSTVISVLKSLFF